MEIQRDKFYSMTTKERIVLSQELYRFLAPIMNEIHEVNYSERDEDTEIRIVNIFHLL